MSDKDSLSCSLKIRPGEKGPLITPRIIPERQELALQVSFLCVIKFSGNIQVAALETYKWLATLRENNRTYNTNNALIPQKQ